jgi:hypothetical protein
MANRQGKITRIPTNKFGWASRPNKKIITHPILDIITEYINDDRWVAVRLAGKPYVDVVLSIESDDIIYAPNTLTFTYDNWDQYQNINLPPTGSGTINISGEEDLVNSTSILVPEYS